VRPLPYGRRCSAVALQPRLGTHLDFLGPTLAPTSLKPCSISRPRKTRRSADEGEQTISRCPEPRSIAQSHGEAGGGADGPAPRSRVA
jgi:hypothetical protein